jgi:DNA sulfur modification protein DndD
MLCKYAKIILLWPAIKKSMQIIREKRKNKEIPPKISKVVLESIIQDNTCSICGRSLDDDARKQVEKLLNEISFSSVIVQQLQDMENPLHEFEERIKRFREETRIATQEIDAYEKDLTNIQRRINEIDREMSGYDAQKIREWHEKRRKFEQIRDENQKNLGGWMLQEEKYAEKIVELQNELDTELKRQKKVKELKKQIDFCAKSLEVARKTREVIVEETRKRIELETKKLFFELLWKKGTFKDVSIDEDYNLNLIHSMGYECLGSISAAERELLALAFTLALHKVSGFDSPILIDTPIARVSDEHRENLGRIFLEVSKDKQTILLLAPAEYSQEISRSLDDKCSSRCALRLSSDERETRIEVL